MRQDRIEALLKALGSKKTGMRSVWVEARCPLAHWNHASGKDTHPSFGIRVSDKKKSICKCMSCGFGGDLMDLILRIGALNKRDPKPGFSLAAAASIASSEFDDMELDPHSIPDYDDAPETNELIFPEEWLASFQPFSKFPEAVKYLRSRGVTKAMAEFLEVKYDPLQHRVCFPFRNFKKKLMGVQGRSLDKNPELRYNQYGFKDHRNLHCWMGEDKLDFDKPVVLLEGPFDYTSVLRVYPNVCASFTSGLSVEKVKRLSDACEIVTLYDYGSGGDSARKRIKEVLKGTPVTHLIPTQEQDDAGNMSVEEVEEILEGVVDLHPFE